MANRLVVDTKFQQGQKNWILDFAEIQCHRQLWTTKGIQYSLSLKSISITRGKKNRVMLFAPTRLSALQTTFQNYEIVLTL